MSPNGGEKWTTGQNYSITWKSQALAGNAGIYLAFPDGRLCNIGSAPVSSKTFTFTLKENHPCNQTLHTITTGNYRVALYANNGNPDVDWVARDVSDGDIAIASPAATQQQIITLISPNGGEHWTIGNTYKLKWRLANPVPQTHRLIFALQPTALGNGGTVDCVQPIPVPVPQNGECDVKIQIAVQGDVITPLQPGTHKVLVNLYDGTPCLGLCPPTPNVHLVAEDASNAAFTIVTAPIGVPPLPSSY